jgi:hypothetical protein
MAVALSLYLPATSPPVIYHITTYCFSTILLLSALVMSPTHHIVHWAVVDHVFVV